MNLPFKKLTWLLVLILTSGFMIAGGWVNTKAVQTAKMKKPIAKQDAVIPSQNYPCINFDPSVPNLSKEKTEVYGKYEKLSQSGYPTDVPLSQAIKEFNACYSQKGDAPLTEDEVVMAMMYGTALPECLEVSPELMADTQKRIFKKLMPKGARFEVNRTTERSLFSDDEEEERKIRATFGASKIILKQWRINLYRGLDVNPITSESLKPDQKLLIRQRFYGFDKFENKS